MARPGSVGRRTTGSATKGKTAGRGDAPNVVKRRTTGSGTLRKRS